MTNFAEISVDTERFRADVVSGLSRPQKRIAAKYFYDAEGSRLFDRITELDEYYPTRVELGILASHVDEMAERCGPKCLLIELGAGSLTKVRLLLDRLDRPAGFVPVDVSGEHLESAADQLKAEYPGLAVHPVCADFTAEFALPIRAARRVVYFPGSTLGNFEPAEADALMRKVAKLVGPGGGFLIGVDLRKDPAVLDAAYNDRLGVTAAFNRNLLVRINRELGADFEPESFKHRAFYNRVRSRIEMHLVSTLDQRVRIGEDEFAFRRGESIHTENSYKYDLGELGNRAAACGLRTEAAWTDPNRYFGMLFLRADS